MMLVPRAEACRQVSDLRARFLLGFIDDVTSVFDLIQNAGMPPDEAADTLADLFERGIVGFATPT